MILNVKVIPNAKRNTIEESENSLKVYLTAPPLEGKANKALIELLAKHFGIRKSNIRILSGERSREKKIEIAEKDDSNMRF